MLLHKKGTEKFKKDESIVGTVVLASETRLFLIDCKCFLKLIINNICFYIVFVIIVYEAQKLSVLNLHCFYA